MESTQAVRFANIVQFPSMHSADFVAIRVVKLLFELTAKLTIVWWALPLLWGFEKLRFRAGIWVVKQIPNFLSYLRMAAIPYIVFQLVLAVREPEGHSANLWLVIMVVTISLDALDGPCARDLNAVSEFGKRLDPASDKFCFAIIVLGYCIGSVFQYSLVFCAVVLGFVLWCLYTEYKLIRLAVGPFNALLKSLRYYDPAFADPGAFGVGKIKFNLQMLACVVGWGGLVFFSADPTAILAMTLILVSARSFGAKSLQKHTEEFAWLQVVHLALARGTAILQIDTPATDRLDNVVDIAPRLKKHG